MKKALSLILSIILACMSFVSCSEKEPQDTAPVTNEPAASGIQIINSEGKSDYSIVYDDALDLFACCQDMKEAFYTAYKISIFPKKASKTEIGEYEILVGQTNRPESAALQAEIAENEYAIKLVGKKVVINSLTERGIIEGVNYFCTMFISSSNSKCAIPDGTFIKNPIPSEPEITAAGWTFATYKATNGIDLPYQIYMPEKFTPDKEYPVLLFMHGLGSVGTDGNHINGTVAEILRIIPESKYKNDVIIIAPQHPKGQKWVEVSYTPGTYDFDKTPMSKWLAASKELLDKKMDELPIDDGRVYGYGNSMGAFATIYMAMTYPDLYAAIVPVAGGCDPSKASLIKDVPIWLFHGDADTTVNIAGSKTLYENLTSLGASDAKLTVFKGVGHASQGCFVTAAKTEGLLDWMFSHSK